MSSRVKMKDEKQRGVPGTSPEFGAIFMSNSATKRECFQRKLFGLPSSYAHFVNHVKAGMILFLFEFEKRELHGVFQASCDGEMNIVPNAFNSSGKQFPAQVKFTHLWSCTPLSEKEFRDAIRENYFSAKKFSFGLSEDQVVRLLSLFSLRKIKEQAPERHLTSSELAGPSGSSTSKVKRVVHTDRVLMSTQVTSEHKADSKLKLFLSTVHPGDPFCNDGKEINDERFQIPQNIGGENKMDGKMAPGVSVKYFGDSSAKIRGDINGNRLVKSDRARYEKNVNVGYSIGDFGSFSDFRFTRGGSYENGPIVSMGYSLGNSREASDGVRFTRSGRFKNEHFGGKVFVPATSMECPSFFPTNHNASSYSSNHVSNADSCAQDPTRPSSTFICTMEPKRSNISYPTTYGDAIVTSTHPYVPSINGRCSSSLGMGQDSSSLHSLQSAPDNSIAGNILPSFGNQPLSYLESGSTSICPDVDSNSRNHTLLARLNQYEHYSKASLSRPASGKKLTVKSSENEGYDGISFLMHSQSGNNGRISEPLSSSSFGLSYPYYPISSEDKPGNKMPQFENAVEFATDVPAFDECQFLLGGHCPVQPKSTEQHTRTSLNPSVYQNSESIDADCQKKRGSVFSRLALAPKVCRQENNVSSGNNVHGIDNSVDEVMSTLYHSSYPWLKASRKSLIKRDCGANIRNKKQVEMSSSSLKDRSAISKEMSVKCIPPESIPPVEENDSQQAEGTPFVNFKRRSVVKKPHPEKDTSTGQRKRRKLIRPDFGKNHPSEEKAMDADATENLRRPSLESSVGPETVSVSHINENTISEFVKLVHGISQIDHEGKHTVNTGRNSSHEYISVEGEAPSSLQRPSLESSVGTEKVSVGHVNKSKIYEYVKLLRGMSRTDHEGKHTVDIGSSSSENISVNGDGPEKLQRRSPESSIDNRYTNFNASVSLVSKIRQTDEVLDLLHQTSHEGKSISMGRHSNMEEVKVKSCGRNADEDSKEPFEKDHSQDVSCGKLCTKADESFSAKDTRQDELCQGGGSASPFVLQDSSPKVIEEIA